MFRERHSGYPWAEALQFETSSDLLSPERRSPDVLTRCCEVRNADRGKRLAGNQIRQESRFQGFVFRTLDALTGSCALRDHEGGGEAGGTQLHVAFNSIYGRPVQSTPIWRMKPAIYPGATTFCELLTRPSVRSVKCFSKFNQSLAKRLECWGVRSINHRYHEQFRNGNKEIAYLAFGEKGDL